MAKRVVRWFVYPLDSHTNARIAEMLDEGRSMMEITCADRRRRPVWECDREFVSLLRNNSKLKFRIYKELANGSFHQDIGKDLSQKKYGDLEKLKAHLERMKPKRRPKATNAS